MPTSCQLALSASEAYQSEHLTSPKRHPRPALLAPAKLRLGESRVTQSPFNSSLHPPFSFMPAAAAAAASFFGCLFVYRFFAACGVSILSRISTAVKMCQIDWRGHVKTLISAQMMLLKIFPFSSCIWNQENWVTHRQRMFWKVLWKSMRRTFSFSFWESFFFSSLCSVSRELFAQHSLLSHVMTRLLCYLRNTHNLTGTQCPLTHSLTPEK